jgi:hypothetical protein
MIEIVTLKLPETLARRASEVASRTNRRLEEVLLDWLSQVEAEPPVESLPDDQILALCDLQLDPGQAEELSDLLARSREGLLSEPERQSLDTLMQLYRAGLVRKAQALKEAVARGLRPPLR